MSERRERIIIFKFAFQANNYNVPDGTNYNATKVANDNKFASEFEYEKELAICASSFFVAEINVTNPNTIIIIAK